MTIFSITIIISVGVNRLFNNTLIIVLLIMILGFAVAVYALLMQVFGISSEEKSTIISGILGLIGGITGALGAYTAAKIQISSQIKQMKIENSKKARPFIVCNDFRANIDLSDVEVHQDTKIIFLDYYNKLKTFTRLYDNKASFFQVKFVGTVDVILNCEFKLYLDEKYYEKSYYSSYLDHMANSVEVYIPIPYVTKEQVSDAKPDRLEIMFDTIENEKMHYTYSHKDKYFKLSVIDNEGEKSIFYKDFAQSEWILPGRKKLRK